MKIPDVVGTRCNKKMCDWEQYVYLQVGTFFEFCTGRKLSMRKEYQFFSATKCFYPELC